MTWGEKRMEGAELPVLLCGHAGKHGVAQSIGLDAWLYDYSTFPAYLALGAAKFSGLQGCLQV